MPLAEWFLFAGGFVLLLFVGLVAFFALLLTMVVRIFRYTARAIFGPMGDGLLIVDGAPICPNPRCRHANRPGTRFCGRCGRPIG